MSHTSRVRTTMTEAAIIALALSRLGVNYTENARIKLWSEGQKVDFALGPVQSTGLRGLGLNKQRETDGVFQLVADFGYMDETARHEYRKISSEADTDDYGKRANGASPNLLAQAYAAVLGLGYANANGCQVTELPQDNGDLELQIREGHLPPGAHITVLCRHDGTCAVSGWNFSGQTCRQYTGPLLAALGVVEEDADKLDFNHATVGGTVAHAA